MALNKISGLKQPREDVPAERAQEQPFTEKTNARPRQFIYGRIRAEGTVVFAHQTTERIAVTSAISTSYKVLHQIIAFADHEVEAFDEVWFDNAVVPLEADGSVTLGDDLHDWVYITKHLGADSQVADPILILADPDKWTSTDRLRGVAYLYVMIILNKAKFPNGQSPNITAVIRGKRVFNPTSHAVAYSANAALCQRDYMYDRRYGMSLRPLYTTGTVTVTNGSDAVTGSGTAFLANVLPGDQFDVVGDGTWARVVTVTSDTALTLVANYAGSSGGGKNYAVSSDMDEAGVVTAAEVCSQSVALAAGGSEARYEANGVIHETVGAASVIGMFELAMAGNTIDTGTKWLIRAGAFVATTAATLVEDDFFAPPKVELRRDRTQLFNSVRGVFVSPDHLWQKTDLPLQVDATYVTQDDGEQIEANVLLPLTTSFAAGQRILRILLRQSREQESVVLSLKLKGLQFRPGSPLAVTNANTDWTDKDFTVDALGLFSDSGGYGIVLGCTSTQASVYAWSANEVALQPLPTVTLPSVTSSFSPPRNPNTEEEENQFSLAVSGLEIVNVDPNNPGEFIGADCEFTWRDNAEVAFDTPELGNELVGQGFRDPYFLDWFVIISNTDGTVRRTEAVTGPFYVYTLLKNYVDGVKEDAEPDFLSAVRNFRIEVFTRTTDGRITVFPARLEVNNPAPPASFQFNLVGGLGKVEVTDLIVDYGASEGTDSKPDVTGMVVWAATVAPPDTTNPAFIVYDGAKATVIFAALANEIIYVRIALRDAFPKGLIASPIKTVKTLGPEDETATVVTWDLDVMPWLQLTLAGNTVLTTVGGTVGETYFLSVIEDGESTLIYDAVVFFFPDGGTQPTHEDGESADYALITMIMAPDNQLISVAQRDFRSAN